MCISEEDNIDYNNPDELIKLIEAKLKTIRAYMKDKDIKRPLFDIYSYMSWALEFFILNLYDCSPHMDILSIRNLIFIHIEEYDNYVNKTKSDHNKDRYMAALEVMKDVERISRAFV